MATARRIAARAKGTGRLATIGGACVLALTACHRTTPPADSAQGGLVVQTGRDAGVKPSGDRLLECYVGGRLVGRRTLADCARRNGVPAEGIDVGLANPVTLAPASGTAVNDAAAADGHADPPAAETAVAGVADCAQFDDGAWVTVARATTLGACVRALFDGQCLAAGVMSRGRWADRLLRLASRRIEVSTGGAGYRLIAVQSDGCAVAPLSGSEG